MTLAQAEGLHALAAAAQREEPRLLDGTITTWYRNWRAGHRIPIPTRDAADAATCNELARAVLKADGILIGPPLAIHNNDFQVGDVVVFEDHPHPLHDLHGSELPEPGVPGTITTLDAGRTRNLNVDFPIHGTHWIGADTAAGRLLRHDYTQPAAPHPAVRSVPPPEATIDLPHAP